MTHSVTIQRRTNATGDSHSPTGTWANHLTGVLGRLRQLSGSEGVRYGRESGRRSWTFDCDSEQDITDKDRIVYSDTTGTGTVTRTLDIQSVLDPHQLGHHFIVVCDEAE